MISNNASIERIRQFLQMLGFQWNFAYWKEDMQTFSVAEKFDDVNCVNGNKIVLELFKDKKIYYCWFVITESIFKKIVSKNHSMSCEIVEDFSYAWQEFSNNNNCLTN